MDNVQPGGGICQVGVVTQKINVQTGGKEGRTACQIVLVKARITYSLGK